MLHDIIPCILTCISHIDRKTMIRIGHLNDILKKGMKKDRSVKERST
jgi:hypothetical protein